MTELDEVMELLDREAEAEWDEYAESLLTDIALSDPERRDDLDVEF